MAGQYYSKNFNYRSHYRPQQPSIPQTDTCVKYREKLPDPLLQDIIYCYWELKTTAALQNAFTYRVVADGCIDIFFPLDHPSESFIMGLCKRHTEFQLNKSFHYVGIRFFPSMFPALFKTDARSLSNRTEPLELVVKEAASFIENRFFEKDNFDTIAIKLDAFFNRQLTKLNAMPDKRLQHALYLLFKNSGYLYIESDLETGLSPRQLRRYFSFYIGDTAKTFSQIIRFQSVLQAKPSKHSLRKFKIFYDAGYYDQAHFTREFKNFYGLTPGKALGG